MGADGGGVPGAGAGDEGPAAGAQPAPREGAVPRVVRPAEGGDREGAEDAADEEEQGRVRAAHRLAAGREDGGDPDAQDDGVGDGGAHGWVH